MSNNTTPASNTPRRTQVERRETAERRILTAAIEIVAERGLSGLTLAAAGERAGYSRGIVSHHFGRKGDLLVALVQFITTRFSFAMGERQDIEPGLPMIEGVIAEYFARAAKDARMIRALNLVLSEGVSNDTIREPLATANRRSIKGLTAHLQAGMQRGEVREDIDPKHQAMLILAGLRGITAQWLIDPAQVDLSSAREEFVANLRRSLAP